MTCGFTKGVSVDVLYLEINDFFELNLPYSQSDFMVNSGSHKFYVIIYYKLARTSG